MDTFNTGTILLVEDEEDDILFMQLALEKAGLMSAFHLAEDGEEAINYLRGQDGFADRARFPLPAVVFLDLKLPKIMGMDVLKWIRDQPALDTMVVIVLTSSQQRSDIQKACALGANSYLVKPSNPLGLNEMIDVVKRYWLQLNQPTASLAEARSPAGVR